MFAPCLVVQEDKVPCKCSLQSIDTDVLKLSQQVLIHLLYFS